MKKLPILSLVVLLSSFASFASIIPSALAAGFSTSASLTPSSPVVAHVATLNVAVADTGAAQSGLIVDIELYNSSNQRVLQKFFENQNFATGESHGYAITWTPSATGSYIVRSGIFTSGWANNLDWQNSVLTLSVVNAAPAPTPVPAGSFSSSASLVPANPTAGSSASIGVALKDNLMSLNNGIVDLEVYNANNQKVVQKFFENQNFGVGDTNSYSLSFTPNTAGQYKLKIGVFASNWSKNYWWNDSALALSVGSTPTATSVSVSLPTTTQTQTSTPILAPAPTPTITPTSTPAPAPTPTPTPTSAPTTFAGNPFAGAKLYVNPYSDPKIWADQHRSWDPSNAALMDKIANQSETAWFGNWNSNVYQDVKNRVDTVTAAGDLPVLVAYNIPQRDCGGYSAGGSNSPDAYRAWIQSVADAIGNRKAVIILEPDALAMIDCLSAGDQATRYLLLQNAVQVLNAKGAISVYIDAGHPNWISAPEMASRLTKAGIAQARGFSLNISNFFTNADNITYGQQISAATGGKTFVVETSRNGLGPTADYQWCNPPGRALGMPPTVTTDNPLVDAYLWVKGPAGSDGQCNGGPAAGIFWPDYALGLASRTSW